MTKSEHVKDPQWMLLKNYNLNYVRTLKRLGGCPNVLFLAFAGIFVVYACDSLHMYSTYNKYFPPAMCTLSRSENANLYSELIVSLLSFFADSFTDYFSDYECNQPLMERAVLTATSSLTERGPEKARLNGKFIILFRKKSA